MMLDIPWGYKNLIAHYECKWCMLIATVTISKGNYDGSHLEGWRPYDMSYGPGLDLCSSDCQKELDAARAQALAMCEPSPERGREPDGYREALEKLRLEKMEERKTKYDQ